MSDFCGKLELPRHRGSRSQHALWLGATNSQEEDDDGTPVRHPISQVMTPLDLMAWTRGPSWADWDIAGGWAPGAQPGDASDGCFLNVYCRNRRRSRTSSWVWRYGWMSTRSPDESVVFENVPDLLAWYTDFQMRFVRAPDLREFGLLGGHWFRL